MRGLSGIFIRFSIAFLVSSAIGVLFLKYELPYNAEIIMKRPFSVENQVYYFDLDNNGYSERIIQKMTSPGQASLVLFDENNITIDQYNVEGRVIRHCQLFKGDYNNDNSCEIYLFTYIGDSLFLNVIDPYATGSKIVARRYIDGCKTLDGEALYRIDGSGMEDVNDDGFEEFYFSIGAGYTLQPRSLNYYDLVNDKLRSSQLAGVASKYRLDSYDIDGDGKLEFWGNYNAVGNYKTSIPYSDSSAWLMIYSYDLSYKFPPIEYKGFTSIAIPEYYTTDNNNYLAVLRKYDGSQDSLYNELHLLTTEGKHIRSINLESLEMGRLSGYYMYEGKIWIHNDEGKIAILDEYLTLLDIKEEDWMYGSCTEPLDLIDNGKLQLCFLDNLGNLAISTPDLKLQAEINLSENTNIVIPPVPIKRSDGTSGFFLKTIESEYLISLSPNPHRNWVFFYLLLIFSLIVLFIYFIQAIVLKQERRRQETENKMRTLQMQTAKSQMNPHFIFNALNSISAMYIKGDTARADAFLTSFSKMIREVVDTSDRLVVSIDEEIEFVRNYLELEQVRYEDRLTFSIDVPERCRSFDLPSMSIHTFVENSIKHGLRGKNKMHIQVDASCEDSYITIIIMDNGVGYEKSQREDEREGRGLKIISDIFDTYHNISGKLIEYTLSDLGTGSDDKTGTKVEILVKV